MPIHRKGYRRTAFWPSMESRGARGTTSNKTKSSSIQRTAISPPVARRMAKHRRYIGKLYAKEVVLINFPHESPGAAMERLIELTLRTEENL